MDRQTTAAEKQVTPPKPGDPLPQIWEPPFERWLRLTDLFLSQQSGAAALARVPARKVKTLPRSLAQD